MRRERKSAVIKQDGLKRTHTGMCTRAHTWEAAGRSQAG